KKVWGGLPEQIDQTHEKDKEGDGDNFSPAALGIARKQQREREYKVDKDQQCPKILPAVLQAHDVPADFRQHVAGPDNQPLREREISPQHDESKHQLAKVVQVIDLEDARNR